MLLYSYASINLNSFICLPPDDPQDAQVAGQYKHDLKAFERTARKWTDTYAKPKKPEQLGSFLRPWIDHCDYI